jgi:two-component system phosphate regulon sensor histidine kinase PhoR
MLKFLNGCRCGPLKRYLCLSDSRMKSSRVNKPMVGIFICLAILLAAQSYHLYSSIRLQRIEFNKSINTILEKTVAENRKLRADSLSNSMYRWLMDTTLTRIYSNPYDHSQMKYYVEDVRADEVHVTSFSLAFENRSIVPGNDSIKSIVAKHIVQMFRNQYVDYESVFYYTQTAGDSATKLSTRLRNDTLMLQESFTNNIRQANITPDFAMKFIDDQDSSQLNTYMNQAFHPQGLQTRPYKTGGYNKTQRVYVVATFEDPTQWLFGRLLVPIAISVGIVLGVAAALFYFYRVIRKQKQLAQLKNDFIDNMTHELKTPIATIAAAAEALQHFGAQADVVKSEKYLNNITHQAGRLNTIVNKVLEVSSFDRNDVLLQKAPFRLNDLMREVQETHKTIHPEVTLSMDLATDTEITGDRFHLKHVLFNLVDNAVKYNTSAKPLIRISTKREQDHSDITVYDNGEGIQADHLPRIFEKFYRVPTGNVHRVKGFGLGLYYVKKIIDLHNGIVTIESEPGKGTRVHIQLPVSA